MSLRSQWKIKKKKDLQLKKKVLKIFKIFVIKKKCLYISFQIKTFQKYTLN